MGQDLRPGTLDPVSWRSGETWYETPSAVKPRIHEALVLKDDARVKVTYHI
jgi:hypothetical protein